MKLALEGGNLNYKSSPCHTLVDNPHKILIVDDNEGSISSSRALLEGLGFMCITACSGYEALDVAQKINPDLILLDIMLPDLDGLLVLLRLRASGIAAKICMYSSLSDPDYVANAFSFGTNDYIVKPSYPWFVGHRVHQLLGEESNEFTTKSYDCQFEAILKSDRELYECAITKVSEYGIDIAGPRLPKKDAFVTIYSDKISQLFSRRGSSLSSLCVRPQITDKPDRARLEFVALPTYCLDAFRMNSQSYFGDRLMMDL